jgi:ribose-phosphate pyrophosphokinase
MTAVVFPAFAELALAERLAERLGAIAGVIESRRFPDEETYLRLLTPVTDRDDV